MRCRAFSARDQSWVRFATDWRRPFARLLGGVLSGTGATSPPALRLREPGAQFAEPFALLTNDSIWLDMKVRVSPVGPRLRRETPNSRSTAVSIGRASVLLKRCYLLSYRAFSMAIA
jgi:hypothetical protein